MSKQIYLTKEDPPREVILIKSKNQKDPWGSGCKNCILYGKITCVKGNMPTVCMKIVFGKIMHFHFELAFPKTE